MTEPTAEQIEAETEAATLVLDGYGAAIETQWINPLKHRIATALARVRKEAHAAGRDEGLDAAAHLSETFDELVHMHDLPDAIRALRGRT